MKPMVNVYVQIAALTAVVLFRLATPPGWLAALFLFTLVGPLAVLTPTVLAVRAEPLGERLPRPVTAAFLITATSLVVAGALVPEMDDQHDYLPLLSVFAPSRAGHPSDFVALWGVGYWSVLVFLAGLVAIVVTMAAARKRITVPVGGVGRPARLYRRDHR